jgi:hypothetical protein
MLTDYKPPQRIEVTVVDIQMPFWSMVAFVIKWTLASIPAVIILCLLMAVLMAILSVFGLGTWGGR